MENATVYLLSVTVRLFGFSLKLLTVSIRCQVVQFMMAEEFNAIPYCWFDDLLYDGLSWQTICNPVVLSDKSHPRLYRDLEEAALKYFLGRDWKWCEFSDWKTVVTLS